MYALLRTCKSNSPLLRCENQKRQESKNVLGCLEQFNIPGNALHEKGLQRQISVGTLLSSQERRALFVPLINRRLTADEPLVNRSFCFFVGFKNELDCSCFRRDIHKSVLDSLEGKQGGGKSLGRIDPTASCPTQPRPAAPPCAAPTRPARGVSGFWIRQGELPDFRTCLARKGFTETNRRRYTGQQPGTKSALSR